MVKIVQKEDPVLRHMANEVPVEEIKSAKIKTVLKNMKEALYSQDDGIAIAAPQIGQSLRIFMVSGKVLATLEGKEDGHEEDLTFINPRIMRISKESKETDEGCLSVRYLYGKVKRAVKASVTAYDEDGVEFKRDGHGLLAQVFQHEIDHLNGILFTDKAKDIEEVLPEHPTITPSHE
ncbi:MAG: peptide deformylase [Patescibacteria group bacterium]|nr:peptide deformylase [bacterium]MDZ4240641.1 peptide deformylase [Patescibacteria group bacterium]